MNFAVEGRDQDGGAQVARRDVTHSFTCRWTSCNFEQGNMNDPVIAPQDAGQNLIPPRPTQSFTEN